MNYVNELLYCGGSFIFELCLCFIFKLSQVVATKGGVNVAKLKITQPKDQISAFSVYG